MPLWFWGDATLVERGRSSGRAPREEEAEPRATRRLVRWSTPRLLGWTAEGTPAGTWTAEPELN